VWVPGLAVCPVKAPWRETSAKIAFGKAEIAFGKAEIAFGKAEIAFGKAEKRPETI